MSEFFSLDQGRVRPTGMAGRGLGPLPSPGYQSDSAVRCLRQSRKLERFEPLKAVGGVTPVLNADLRGQKPMRRFRSPQGPALRAGQFSVAALRQAPCGKEMKGMRNRAFATVPPRKTPSEAPHRAFARRPSPNKSVAALLSAFLSVIKYGAVKLFEFPGRAGGLPMKLLPPVCLC
jgi:hypothetical protein